MSPSLRRKIFAILKPKFAEKSKAYANRNSETAESEKSSSTGIGFSTCLAQQYSYPLANLLPEPEALEEPHNPQEIQLEREAARWVEELRPVLLAYENHLRRVEGKEPLIAATDVLPFVTMRNQFKLLNWKVWCMRYHITPKFIVEALLYLHRRQRVAQPTRHGLFLGVSTSTLTGRAARIWIEETVAKRYPNGENRVAAATSVQAPPVTMLPYATPEEMVDGYSKIMEERRRARHHTPLLRPYRGRFHFN